MKSIKILQSCAAVSVTTMALLLVGCGDGASQAGQGSDGAPTLDIIETADDAGSFQTLLAAVEAAGLTSTLRGDGPFTVFAPTDDAFAALPAGTVEDLLLPQNIETLTAILTYHVLGAEVRAADAIAAGSAETLNGQRVIIEESGGAVRVNDANVVAADVLASNGVIHVIDAVLLPE
ncbi:MAG: fasciclin domain-containing protein [Candidatus Binatia bacterium]|nr:fasciclin domain-containing protein [Candidatus Binatia bacterium]